MSEVGEGKLGVRRGREMAKGGTRTLGCDPVMLRKRRGCGPWRKLAASVYTSPLIGLWAVLGEGSRGELQGCGGDTPEAVTTSH